MKEIWVPVFKHKGLYEISSKSKIRNLKTNKILKQSLDAYGYFIVGLRKNKKFKTYKVHRLMLFSFVGPHNKKNEGAHLDGNPKNNLLTNLVWATRAENESHKILHRTQSFGENHHRSKLKNKNVYEIKNLISKGVMQSKIAKKFNVCESLISEIKTGKKWKSVT